jgi:hypothetical protein
VKCLGRLRAEQTSNDSALRLLSGFRADNFLNSLRALNSVDVRRAQALFIEQLISTERVSGRCLLAETIDRANEGKSNLLLLSDPMRNEWIAIEELPENISGQEKVLRSYLEMLREAGGEPPEHLLLAGQLGVLAEATTLSAHARHLRALNLDDHTGIEKAATMLGMAPADLSRACQPKIEALNYFSLGDAWPERRFGETTWSLLARAAVTRFARGLVGFHFASPEHLYQNFLAGVGSIRVSAHDWEVQLPRCALAIVLQLSGMGNRTYTVPWLNDREVCLLPPP